MRVAAAKRGGRRRTNPAAAQMAAVAVVAVALVADGAAASAPAGMARAMRTAAIEQTLASNREPVIIDGRLFRLEVAATPRAWERGLMQRERLDADGGMIFAYPYPQMQSFWMANCLIDIDIIFVDARGRIVAMHTMSAEPLQQPGESDAAYHARLPRYTSGQLAQFAIELRAGTLKTMSLRTGDVVHFDRARLAARAR